MCIRDRRCAYRGWNNVWYMRIVNSVEFCAFRRKHILQQIRDWTVYTLPGIVHWVELRVAMVGEMSLKQAIRAQKYPMCDVQNKFVCFPKRISDETFWYAMCDLLRYAWCHINTWLCSHTDCNLFEYSMLVFCAMHVLLLFITLNTV